MNGTIILRPHNGQWFAVHTGELAEIVRELFGTAAIPTPFSTSVPVAQVAAELRVLNPGIEVLENPVTPAVISKRSVEFGLN